MIRRPPRSTLFPYTPLSRSRPLPPPVQPVSASRLGRSRADFRDRKSTRLNSSHLVISYAVFCLKKKKHRLQDSGIVQTRARLPTPVPGTLGAISDRLRHEHG